MSSFDPATLHAAFDALDVETLSARRGNKWTLYGPGVIPVWVADMDFPPAAPVRQWIADTALAGDLGYAPRAQFDPMPGAFARWSARRHGYEPDPGAMKVLVDIVQCLYVAVQAYSEPGDGVILQTPIYPPMLASVADTGRRQVLNPLLEGPQRFEVDFDRLRDQVDARTRILVLCSPHNPSGRVFDRTELESFAEIALANDLVVLADEIHADLLYDGRRHVPFASLGPEVAARTVTFTSATKSFNLAGLRACLAIFGSEDLRRRFHFLPERCLGGLSTLNSAAAAMAWDECEEWLDATLAYLQANRDALARRVTADLPGVRYRPPESTFLAWLDCKEAGLGADAFEFFLRDARVALSDGCAFGPGGEGCVRFNFATSRQVLEEAVDRMAAALRARR